jgi:hypothetical protein
MASSLGIEGMTATGPKECPRADDIGPSLDLAVHSFEGIRAGDLRPALAWERHVGEDVVARGVHQCAELGLSFAESIGDDSPVRLCFCLGVQGKDRLQHRGNRSALLGWGAGESVAHPVNAAPLPRGVEDAAW